MNHNKVLPLLMMTRIRMMMDDALMASISSCCFVVYYSGLENRDLYFTLKIGLETQKSCNGRFRARDRQNTAYALSVLVPYLDWISRDRRESGTS